MTRSLECPKCAGQRVYGMWSCPRKGKRAAGMTRIACEDCGKSYLPDGTKPKRFDLIEWLEYYRERQSAHEDFMMGE